eukprot:6196158-Pleurochrysis_carterae.AAC.4
MLPCRRACLVRPQPRPLLRGAVQPCRDIRFRPSSCTYRRTTPSCARPRMYASRRKPHSVKRRMRACSSAALGFLHLETATIISRCAAKALRTHSACSFTSAALSLAASSVKALTSVASSASYASTIAEGGASASAVADAAVGGALPPATPPSTPSRRSVTASSRARSAVSLSAISSFLFVDELSARHRCTLPA